MGVRATPVLEAAMKGQFHPTQKGTTPDRTSLQKVAGVASGKVDAGKAIVTMPKGAIDKHSG